MQINATTLQAAIAAVLLSTGAARADNSPLGLWIDHTGRGGVEIKECNGNKLCGHIVWLKDSKNMEACGEQVLGDVKPVGGGKWDNGWIYDPDAKSKYDVELTPMGDKLKVVGYAGSKWLSETMTWKRAPADLQRCSKDKAAAAPAAATDAKTADIKADTKTETKPDSKQADLTPAPAPQDNAKAESKPEATDTAKAEPQPEPQAEPQAESKAEPNGDTAKPQTENNDSATNDDDDDKEDAPKKGKGKAIEKLAEAMNFKKLKNGKCNMDVPFVDMKVTFDCDK